jgi:S-adenosylmethionine:tRNA ribosyltransferase-isomerase
MIAAVRPIQRPRDARLLVVDARGAIHHALRSQFVDSLRPGDLVVANDAVTLPASLQGVHVRTGGRVEVRLAGRRSLASEDVDAFAAIVFGDGDFRTRTEDRPQPPSLQRGDRLALGPLTAAIEAFLDHPRLVALRFDATAAVIWAGLARHGRPIQYAHLPVPLEPRDVWTPIAARPAAFEPPSASFVVDWQLLDAMRTREIRFATLTLTAGISSTGDVELDKRLPLDEPYHIPGATANAVHACRDRGGRVVAVGTTVVRALEHSAVAHGDVRGGEDLATQRLGPGSHLRVVDAILSGTHEPGVSHYELLRAFTDDPTLDDMNRQVEALAYRTHEFGDSVLIERREPVRASAAA